MTLPNAFPNVGGGDRLASGISEDAGQARTIAAPRRPRGKRPFRKSVVGVAGAAVSFTLDGVPGQIILVSSLVVAVSTASPTSEVLVTIRNGIDGEIVWRDVIGALAITGTRVGWVRDHSPYSMLIGESYIVTASAPGGTTVLYLNTDGTQGEPE